MCEQKKKNKWDKDESEGGRERKETKWKYRNRRLWESPLLEKGQEEKDEEDTEKVKVRLVVRLPVEGIIHW